MNLKQIKEKRIKSLQNAYEQLSGILDTEYDARESEPEKRLASLKAYKQAAEDSDYILKLIMDLMDVEEEVKVKKVTKESKGLSPEDRIKRN